MAYAKSVQWEKQGMIHATYIKPKTPMYVASNSSVKRYMDYTCVTDTSSKQYRLLQKAVIGSDGLLRIDGYICVALGQKYGQVGDRFTFVIGGKYYNFIIADSKANCDTNGGWTGKDGHLVEMIVCTSRLNEKSRLTGDCNYTISGNIERILKE